MKFFVKHPLLILLIIAIFLSVIYASYSLNSNNPEVIEVAYLPCDHHAAFFVADSQGLYQKNGLQVEGTEISSGSNIVQAVANGEIDIGYVGLTPALKGISQGMPIKIVGAVNLEGSGIVVSPNSTINQTTDLIGRKIATPGVSSIQQILLLYQLQKYNISSSQINAISMNIYVIPDALAAQKVDAYIAYEPYVSLAPYRGTGKVMMYSSEIMADQPCCVIIAREDFINQNNDKLKKFLEIHKNSTKFVNKNKNQSAKMVSQKINSNAGLEQISLQHIIFVSQLDSNFQQSVINFMNIELQMGYLKKNMTAEEIFDTQFLGG